MNMRTAMRYMKVVSNWKVTLVGQMWYELDITPSMLRARPIAK